MYVHTFGHLMKGEQKACLFQAQLFAQIPVHYLSHQMDLQQYTHIWAYKACMYLFITQGCDMWPKIVAHKEKHSSHGNASEYVYDVLPSTEQVTYMLYNYS